MGRPHPPAPGPALVGRVEPAVLVACLQGSAQVGVRVGFQGGRDAVEDFVRTYLPSGSSDAFTSDELSDFRRERGQETAFDPYRNSK